MNPFQVAIVTNNWQWTLGMGMLQRMYQGEVFCCLQAMPSNYWSSYTFMAIVIRVKLIFLLKRHTVWRNLSQSFFPANFAMLILCGHYPKQGKDAEKKEYPEGMSGGDCELLKIRARYAEGWSCNNGLTTGWMFRHLKCWMWTWNLFEV